MAQSQYLKRCVLTVNHVTDCLASDRPLVMLFAGDTAGKISCWDVTALLLRHIKDCYDLSCEDEEFLSTETEDESSGDVAVEKLTVNEEKTAFKPKEKEAAYQGDVSSRNRDIGVESVTAPNAEENSFTVNNSKVNISSNIFCKDGVTEDCVTENCVASSDTCDVINAVVAEKQRNERTESSKFSDVRPSAENEDLLHSKQQDLENVTYTNEPTVVGCEKPNQCSLKELQGNLTLNTKCEEQSDFSCLPLGRDFLTPPIHVFDAHQSGVNGIALTRTQGKTKQCSIAFI